MEENYWPFITLPVNPTTIFHYTWLTHYPLSYIYASLSFTDKSALLVRWTRPRYLFSPDLFFSFWALPLLAAPLFSSVVNATSLLLLLLFLTSMGKKSGSSWLTAVKRAFRSPSKDSDKKTQRRNHDTQAQDLDEEDDKVPFFFSLSSFMSCSCTN